MKSILVVLVIIISTQILDTSLNRINTFIINVNSLFWNVCVFIFLIIAFLVDIDLPESVNEVSPEALEPYLDKI